MHHTNREIKANKVLVIDENGNPLGTFPRNDAIQMAEDKGLDLVEVDASKTPSVTKIMDYGQFKYKQQKKEKASRNKTPQERQKEIKLRPVSDDHDIETKLKKVRKFLGEDRQVKIVMEFRGREAATINDYTGKMRQIAMSVENSKFLQEPRITGRQIVMILTGG